MADADVDVLIIGAGLSGIGAAYHLQKRRPTTTYAILEARSDLGGTWDLFRFPGIRSDSDLFTFGYDFKPWESDKSIADGPAIKSYIRETARENGIDRHIRYHHKVLDASWSSPEALWSARVKRSDTGAETVMRCRWLFMAAGYYRYDEGYSPPFRDRERFRGRIVHPQHWPADLDYRGKRVVVIGSGATAVTLLPAMTDLAAHVVMLQRTPSYVLPVPIEDPLAKRLRPLLGRRLTHRITRRKSIAMQKWVYQLCQTFPKQARRLIRLVNARMLPENYPVDIHFNPPYEPWTQRLCAVPAGDLFRVIRQGRASVVTDRITAFTETGIQLESGGHLEADIIVTATGLNLQPFGGLDLVVDGEPIRLSDTVAFKGLMLSSVPNFAFAIGYTSSSWTLKVGLLCEHFIRLLDYMDSHGHDVCTPVADPGMETQPLLKFGAGYVQRSLSGLPRQGTAYPWVTTWNYASDVKLLRKRAVADKHLRFTSRREAADAKRPAQVATA
jgi:monooxygenase